MKRTLLYLASAVLSLLMYSCGSDSGKKNNDSVNVTADANVTNETDCWPKATFNNTELGEDKMGIPHSIVRVAVCKEEAVTDTVTGNMELYDKSQYKDMTIPDNAVAACGGWFAGGGDYYYITSDNDGVEVFHGWLDEGTADNDTTYHWEKVKEIH